MRVNESFCATPGGVANTARHIRRRNPIESILRTVDPKLTRLRVECHAGYKGSERPLRFSLGDKAYGVVEVLERWYGPDDAFFRVRADDGALYVLRHTPGDHGDLWTLED